eukprot:15206435-Heterocapsa_arctica.AAC.1
MGPSLTLVASKQAPSTGKGKPKQTSKPPRPQLHTSGPDGRPLMRHRSRSRSPGGSSTTKKDKNKGNGKGKTSKIPIQTEELLEYEN